MKPQTETLLDYLTALAIGVGLAAYLWHGGQHENSLDTYQART